MAKQGAPTRSAGAAPRKRRHVPLEVERAIEDLALKGWEPIQIYRNLEGKEKFKDKLPSLRTVQTIVKQGRPRDTTGAWTLEDSAAGDAALVLETLAAVIEYSEGLTTAFTIKQAEWIVRIRRAAPDLHLWAAYHLAWSYQSRIEEKISTADLDAYLAFAPWRSDDALARYKEAFRQGAFWYMYQFTDRGVGPDTQYWDITERQGDDKAQLQEEPTNG